MIAKSFQSFWGLFLIFPFIQPTAIAGEITAFDGLGYQDHRDIIPASVLEDELESTFFVDQQNGIELEPSPRGRYYGRRLRWGLNLRLKTWEGGDVALGLRQVEGVISSPRTTDPAWISDRKSGFYGTLALRQEVLKYHGWSLAIIPFLEPGFQSSNSFHLPSKSRLGIMGASSWKDQFWSIHGNATYRYRPVALYGPYRLASDFNFGFGLGLHFNPINFYAEIFERNFYVLNSNDRQSDFANRITQYHKIAFDLEFDPLQVGMFWTKAMKNKVFGAPNDSLGISLTWKVSTFASKRDLPPSLDHQPKEPILTPTSPIDQQNLIPQDLAPTKEDLLDEDQDGSNTPGMDDVEIEQPLPQSQDSEPTSLDEIEKELQEIRLIDQRASLSSPQQIERDELIKGEAEIERLKQVSAEIMQKRKLDEIRRKAHRDKAVKK